MEDLSNTDLVEYLFELKNKIREFKRDMSHVPDELLKQVETKIKEVEQELDKRGVKQI